MKTLVISTLLDIARSQLGVRESENNSGAKVQEYQRATTLGGTHWPWCAALDAWLIKETAKKLGITIPWSNSASCDVILTDGKSRGLFHTTPQPGDVFLVRAKLRNGKLSEHDMIHTGIVETVKSNGTFTEIAGNTNSDGGREGIGVMRTTRTLGARYWFVRVVDGISDGDLQSLAPQPLPAPRPWTASVQIPRGGSGSIVRGLPCKHEGGTILVAIRDWGKATEQEVGYEIGNQAVTLGGIEVPLQARIFDQAAWFPIRALCEMNGGMMMVNGAMRTARAVMT